MSSGAASLVFFQLLAYPLPLQRRQIIDEKFTVEVVYLVLQADGLQSG
jgi:hypothetical protein